MSRSGIISMTSSNSVPKGLPPALSDSLRLCDIAFNAIDDMFSGRYNDKQVHADDLSLVLQRAACMGVESVLCTAGSVEEARDTIAKCRAFRETNTSISNSSSSSLVDNGVEGEGEVVVDSNNQNNSDSDCDVLKMKKMMRRKKISMSMCCTVGVHPTRCNVFGELGVENVVNSLSSLLEDGITDGTVVALGECGLDYDRLHFCSKEQQIIGFEAQLALAKKFRIPVFFHDRNTDGDFLRIISDHLDDIPAGGVVHSFTGTMEEMLSYTKQGLYIGINGCSLKTEDNLQVVRAIPENLILLETDAPWCGIKASHASSNLVTTKFSSVKKEKFMEGSLVKDRTEPCHLIQVLEVVAAVRGCDPIILAQIVHENTIRLFPTIYNN